MKIFTEHIIQFEIEDDDIKLETLIIENPVYMYKVGDKLTAYYMTMDEDSKDIKENITVFEVTDVKHEIQETMLILEQRIIVYLKKVEG